jgi:hypothetical protein
MASTLQESTPDNAQTPRPASPPRPGRPPTPPTLLTWENLPSTSSSPTSSPSSSPVLSPEAQAFDFHSPHSKSAWQLAQSEPAISLHPAVSFGNGSFSFVGDDTEGRTRIQFVDIRSPKKEKRTLNVKRRKTLHVDIPTKYIGHTRDIDDEDPFPVVSLLDDDMDQEEDALQERGRSRVRRSGSEVVIGGSVRSEDSSVVLFSPPRESHHHIDRTKLTDFMAQISYANQQQMHPVQMVPHVPTHIHMPNP